MATVPQRFRSLLTRGQLAEMVAPTYAALRNVDPNEAAALLTDALRDLKLIEGLQHETWRALVAKQPKLDEAELLDKVAAKLTKARRFKELKARGPAEGALAALTIGLDAAAGISGGEALSLLESPEGEKLLARGLSVLGDHLAAELLR